MTGASSKLKIFFIYSDDKHERFIEHLINQVSFCISCGEACDDCRLDYGRYMKNIVGIHRMEENLPDFLDEPEDFLPNAIPETDLLIAIEVHPDILISLPGFLSENGIRALIVPVENGDWVPMGLQKQVEEELNTYGIEYAFPRPYCSLEKTGTPVIDSFIDDFAIGRPMFELKVYDGKIIDGQVVRSSPCGCAWYLNRELIRYKPSIDEKLKETISKAHHSYPCNADMSIDVVFGDAPLHIAGYIHRKAVYDGLIKAGADNDFLMDELTDLSEKIKNTI